MKLNKWNYETHKYDPYLVPEDWIIKMISDNMDEFINCAACGKDVKYGLTYTSLEIHDKVGFGYPVCDKCYQQEWLRRNRYKGEK